MIGCEQQKDICPKNVYSGEEGTERTEEKGMKGRLRRKDENKDVRVQSW